MNNYVIGPNTGLLQASGTTDRPRYVPSPNYGQRSDPVAIDLLVIHNISLPPGEFSGDDLIAFFSNTLETTTHPFYESLVNSRVSAHLFIRRNGEVIQFVPFHHAAHHAGVSEFRGRQGCNDFSIGIELEGTDEIPYTPIQYRQLARIAITLMEQYPGITPDRIVGHHTIAPNRKTDPGPAFDWTYFGSLIVKDS